MGRHAKTDDQGGGRHNPKFMHGGSLPVIRLHVRVFWALWKVVGGNRARYAHILVLPGKAPEHGERGAVRHCAEHFLVRAALRHAPISRQSGRMGSKVRSRKGLEICKDLGPVLN